MKKNEKILAVCIIVLLTFSIILWHEACTYKTRYSKSQKYYISRWVTADVALLRTFSIEALNFINSSNNSEAVVSIRHTRAVMISFREPLYEIALCIVDQFNESTLKMTQTYSCVNFLDLSAERIMHGDRSDIQTIKEGLGEIQNFSNQLLRQRTLTELASEETLRKNYELQNKCRALVTKLEK
ncbi:hypothetical protein [Thermococcus sp.]